MISSSKGAEFFKSFGLVSVARRFKRDIPITPDFDTTRIDGHRVSRCKLVNFPEHRVGGNDVAVSEVIGKADRIDLQGNFGNCSQRLELGSKCEPLPVGIVIEGLDAEAVPRTEQYFAPFVPYGKGKHSTQMLHTILTVLFPGF